MCTVEPRLTHYVVPPAYGPWKRPVVALLYLSDGLSEMTKQFLLGKKDLTGN